MIVDDDLAQRLVEQPTEGLSVERKRWLDPKKPDDVAKIVKGTFALRNRNGGYFVIGFDDKTRQPDMPNQPSDPRTVFSLDAIQGLISRYANETFEIQVVFRERNGIAYPVIAVTDGVRVPVVASNNLSNTLGAKLIEVGDVYFRTLNANGTPSTARARPEDWREILEICFENRDADIGRFVRRHLTGIDFAQLRGSLFPIDATISMLVEDRLSSNCAALLEEGAGRFAYALDRAELTPDEKALAALLHMDLALILDPPRQGAVPDREFLDTVFNSNPNYTGWPIWLDSRSFVDERARPVVREDGWEALIAVIRKHASHHLDFLRLVPSGQFFLRRLLQDDAVPDRVPPGTVLDPILVIIRVAEAIAAGLAFGDALKWPKESRLGFMFRWRPLRGRSLTPWTNPWVSVSGGRAEDNEATGFVEVPNDTPASAITPFVDAATRNLFAKFEGYRFPPRALEEWCQRLLERRLSA